MLTDAGLRWMGIDISPSMLQMAQEYGTTEDLALMDISDGLSFRHGVFDAIVSVSVLQWILKADDGECARKNLLKFFFSAYNALVFLPCFKVY